MEVGDKIFIMRGIIGVIIGFISALLNSPIFVLITMVAAYFISSLLVFLLFKQSKAWNIFGKGTAIFISAWFISPGLS